MQYAINHLRVGLDVLTTNEPINREAGNTAQADLELAGASDIREALTVLEEAAAAKARNFKERVVAELKDLRTNLTKLLAFQRTPVFDSLLPEDRGLLVAQGNAMEEYAGLLEERVARFS